MEIIWGSGFDDQYDCKVERLTESRGRLTITVGEDEIYQEEVNLSYGAIFGPDVEDVYTWQTKIAYFIDNVHNKENK
jgi:hypothetical protein